MKKWIDSWNGAYIIGVLAGWLSAFIVWFFNK